MRRLTPLTAVAMAACAQAGALNQDASNQQGTSDGGIDAPSRRPDAAAGRDASQVTIDAPGSGSDSGPCSFSGVLATYSFSGDTGSQTSTAAASTGGGATAGDISRSAALTAVSGSGSINASGWPSATQHDSTHYFTMSVTPPSGCAMDLSSVAITTKASGTGPAKTQIATSADSFGTATTFTVSTTATATLSVTDATAAVELRVYGYSASSTSGTLRVTDLSISGTLHQ